MIDLTIVVPVFNEGITAIVQTLCTIRKWSLDIPVIFVDDNSTLQATFHGFDVVKQDANVNVIVNDGQGQERALYTGFMQAKTQYVACLDCDGQDSVGTLMQMYNEICKTHAPAIAGVRQSRDDSWFRVLCAKIYHRIFIRVLQKDVPAISNFFIISSSFKDKLNPDFVRGALYLDRDTQYMPYIRGSRQDGKSKFTFRKLLRVARTGLQFAKQERRN